MEKEKNEIYSKVVRAGKRTYFFDVKSTKGNDLYLTLTESKKSGFEGNEKYEKHKIFLYKEDFEKFQEGLEDAISKIAALKNEDTSDSEKSFNSEFSEVTFEEL
ncbi:MAG: PUR family DNA/RNA-binding protein [Bacteroidetes bacterium]|nr:PUR family DNA/RNA-binding protein [Bacteroidota bacterium]